MGYIIMFVLLLVLCGLVDAIVPRPSNPFWLGLRNRGVRTVQLAVFLSPLIFWLMSCKVSGAICF